MIAAEFAEQVAAAAAALPAVADVAPIAEAVELVEGADTFAVVAKAPGAVASSGTGSAAEAVLQSPVEDMATAASTSTRWIHLSVCSNF